MVADIMHHIGLDRVANQLHSDALVYKKLGSSKGVMN